MQRERPALRFGLILAAALALAGCTSDREAGADYEGGGFGNATMNNTLMMSGERNIAISLTKKFAADVQNTVNFAFNSAALDGQAQDILRRQADWIKQFPEVRFRVYGHTDLVGSDAYNKALGLRRAQAVVAFLTAQGISRARLEAVVSFGKTQPLVYTQAPNEQNRRTVTEVSGLMARSPQLLNGKYAEVIFREYVSGATQIPTNQVSNQNSAGVGMSGSGN
ncbi:OmpA family protein [Sinirhodobacter ferrireducens]|uniref:OmpA family protein n=1 Tax=Paenirhodobacter ferrireducens TaxID=1215032 RepID=A0A443L5K0_9RHOB|nr:OmpA family protein [Sinirhodobacter ferrireducens]RWR44450.1 OmpA family protein [Sinirhodobacter ferrireducens]